MSENDRKTACSQIPKRTSKYHKDYPGPGSIYIKTFLKASPGLSDPHVSHSPYQPAARFTWALRVKVGTVQGLMDCERKARICTK